MLKKLLLQKILRYAVEDIDLFNISLSIKFGEKEATYRLNEEGYFEAEAEKPLECNQYLVFPKITQPPENAHSASQTDPLFPIQKARMAEKLRQADSGKKTDSDAKKMRVEIKEEIELVEGKEEANDDGVKTEPNMERAEIEADQGEPIQGKRRSQRMCPFGDHGSKRGGRTKIACGFCFTPVCHQHVYEVCPSCVGDRKLPSRSSAAPPAPPTVPQFVPVAQPPPLILMQPQFPRVATLNFQSQAPPLQSFILPKQSDGKCPIRKIN